MADSSAKIVLCVAPHPDDETLGCGGTLLRHLAEGDQVHWLIVTEACVEDGFAAEKIAARLKEIERVNELYGFTSMTQLRLPATRLDELPKSRLISGIGDVIRRTAAQVVYVPYRNDAHTDHAAVFDAAVACTKVFRYPNVRSVLAYETLSETDFGLKPEDTGFRPSVFVDIHAHVDRKLQIMSEYEGEMGDFPFPRSEKAIRSLSHVRGVQAGCDAAEAFQLLKEIR